MLRSFQFNALSCKNQSPNLPYEKALRDTIGGFSLRQLPPGNFATLLLEPSLLNIDISLTTRLYFTCIYSEPAVTTHLPLTNQKNYLHIIVCCCGLEFQFSSVPAHSRLPSRSTHSTLYVPNPPSPLGYNSKYCAVNTLRFGYKNQPVNAV